VDSIPGVESVVYNQIIFVPNQKRELALLDKKKNRHASMPNPSNLIAVEDIKRVQEVIARENKQLVYTHYNMIVTVKPDTDIQKCTNHLENAFGRMGIHISKRAYNQLELFVNSFPGNCYGMNADYDRFLTLGDAATCLMYKEKIVHSEDTPFKVYYTDRQGVPVAIDISGKEGRNKLTDNSNFFVLGPSGSGKSFYVNSIAQVKGMKDAVSDSVKHVTFSAPAYISVTRSSEPVIGAVAAKTAANKVSAPIKGNGGVYMIQVYAKEKGSEKFDAKQEETTLTNMAVRIAGNQLINDLYQKAKVADQRYLFF
jgi:hypothetical protein